MVTVCIVLHRTTAVVFYSFKAAGHRHLHAETEEVGYFGILIGNHLLSDFNSATVIDNICQT